MSGAGNADEAPGPSIIALMPGLFHSLRPVFEGNSPLIAAGSTLALTDVYMLPVVGSLVPRWSEEWRAMTYGALGGLAFLKRVAETEPSDYYKMLWTPCKETIVWIASCKHTDPLEELLRLVEATGFGNVRVDNLEKHSIVTLGDIISLFRNRSLTSDMTAASVGSRPISISPDGSVSDAIRKMLSSKARRLMIEGHGRQFVSSRSVIRFMFRSDRLFLARDSPRKWIDARVSDLPTKEAGRLSRGDSIDGACNDIGDQTDDCLVTDDGKVVSRWDLVIKPWKAGRLTVQVGASPARSVKPSGSKPT